MAEDRVVSERLIVEFDTTTTDVFNTLSPDGLRVASMAKKLERAALGEWSEKWVLVVDGQEQGRYEGLGDIVFGDCPLMSRIGAKRNTRQSEHGAPLKYISPLYTIPLRTCHAKSKAGVVVGHREAVQRR